MAQEHKEKPLEESENLLVPLEDYLTHGVHVGLTQKTKDMEEFIYKVRTDKLCVFDVNKIDERIRVAANFISQFDPENVLVVSNRIYGRRPVRKFSEYTGSKFIAERMVSGTLTNPRIESYVEPKLLVVTDPISDQQAIREASIAGIPNISICDSNTKKKNVDLIIPSNNKGKSSLALIYWILTREVLKKREIEKEFDASIEDFISKAEPSQTSEKSGKE